MNRNQPLSTSTKPYEISIDEAAWLVYAFLKRPELYNLATTEAIGGTISRVGLKSVTKPFDPYRGAMGWFCRNMYNVPGFPPLFLAFEYGEYRIGEMPSIPKSQELVYAKDVFPFSGELTEEGVKDMLLNHQRPIPIPEEDSEIPDGTISNVEALGFINQMPNDPLGRRYNQHACSFFETEVSDTVRHFLEIDGLEAVRYYFGYDDRDAPHCLSNRIRVVFVGVDASGKNLRPDVLTNVRSYSTLQNSWPPPPPY